MKKSISTMIAVLGAGVLAAQAGLITVTNTTNNQQGDPRTAGNGSTYNTTGSAFTQGSLRAGEVTGPFLDRPEIKFNYANPLGVGESVQSAKLRLYATQITLPASGNGSQLLVYASQTMAGNTACVASDFENSSFSLVGTWTAITNGAAIGWYEFDVTSVVTNDIAKDTTLASVFRLQLNNDTAMDSTKNIQFVNFTDNNPVSGNMPQLVITTIPEPATIGMIGLGALITLLIRRIRIS